eukprot:793497-Rhodomonas_salina.2
MVIAPLDYARMGPGLNARKKDVPDPSSVLCARYAMPSTVLCARYAMSGTAIRARYVMSGTEMRYGATQSARCPVPSAGHRTEWVCCYQFCAMSGIGMGYGTTHSARCPILRRITLYGATDGMRCLVLRKGMVLPVYAHVP